MKKLKIGDKVIYKPKNQKGIVYSLAIGIAYVVYNCNNDWKNYKNYTPAGTHICDLKRGWEEEKEKNEIEITSMGFTISSNDLKEFLNKYLKNNYKYDYFDKKLNQHFFKIENKNIMETKGIKLQKEFDFWFWREKNGKFYYANKTLGIDLFNKDLNILFDNWLIKIKKIK